MKQTTSGLLELLMNCYGNDSESHFEYYWGSFLKEMTFYPVLKRETGLHQQNSREGHLGQTMLEQRLKRFP